MSRFRFGCSRSGDNGADFDYWIRMKRILFLYATTDGHTRKICDRMRTLVQRQGNHGTLIAVADAEGIDLGRFDRIVVGGSIRYGHHDRLLMRWLARHKAVLDQMPNSFFSVNLVARKEEKRSPHTNPYLRKFLRKSAWHPQIAEVFAGRLDYPSYQPFDRFMIRLIMRMTGGPTDPTTVAEFTDWDRVQEFCERVCGER